MGTEGTASRSGSPTLHRRETVTSTQDALRALLTDPMQADADDIALAARTQTAGRGRLGRTWSQRSGTGIALSLAHRTTLPPTARGWAVHAVGVAALQVLRRHLAAHGSSAAGSMHRLGLKWPNDLLDGEGRKIAGILCEAHADRLLIGIGVNIGGPVTEADGAPLATAGWLHGSGGLLPALSDEELEHARRVLEEELAAEIADELTRLDDAHGDAVASGLADRYRMNCITLGCDVVVHPLGADATAPGGAQASAGRAVDVDDSGRLVLETPSGDRRAIDIGDVQHLRTTDRTHPHPQEHQ